MELGVSCTKLLHPSSPGPYYADVCSRQLHVLCMGTDALCMLYATQRSGWLMTASTGHEHAFLMPKVPLPGSAAVHGRAAQRAWRQQAMQREHDRAQQLSCGTLSYSTHQCTTLACRGRYPGSSWACMHWHTTATLTCWLPSLSFVILRTGTGGGHACQKPRHDARSPARPPGREASWIDIYAEARYLL